MERFAGATRLLIVADDSLARLGLTALIEQQQAIVVAGAISGGELADSKSVAAAMALYRPDLLLWELGWQEVERQIALLANASDDLPPVLALCGETLDGDALWVAGARGVLPRAAGGAQILAALHALAAGLSVFARREENPTPPRPASKRGGAIEFTPEPLTPRELQVLQAIADGMANKQIARALGMSEHTVKFHINAILGKLGASSRTDAVVRATRAGLLLL